jgi:hypothetical protein
MRGIMRGMDAAPEAHMDVFTAVPRVTPEPEARPRSGAVITVARQRWQRRNSQARR